MDIECFLCANTAERRSVLVVIGGLFVHCL